MVAEKPQDSSGVGGHAELKERLAEAQRDSVGWRTGPHRQTRGVGPASQGRARGTDAVVSVSPMVAIGLIAAAGILIGLGLFFGLRSDGASAGSSPPGVAAQAPGGQAEAGPVVVQRQPEEAIDDYYMLLRQGMYEVAWNRTTDTFRSKNYPGGYNSYLEAWNGSAEIEVVSRKVLWTRDTTARVSADLHDTGSGDRFTYTFSLVYDPSAKVWKIDAINAGW